MKQDDKFTVINIREYLKKNADDEEQFGEDALRQLLSEFSCEKNQDVEDFLKRQAIVFTNKNQSVTYLVFATDDAQLLGYFADSHTKGNTQKNVQSDNGTLNGTLNPSDEQKERLKALIRQNSKITRKQMADSLDVSARTIQRLLNDMPEIHFTGGGRSGHWEIDGE